MLLVACRDEILYIIKQVENFYTCFCRHCQRRKSGKTYRHPASTYFHPETPDGNL